MFVFVIILRIAVIPLICLLVQAVDQYRFNITGMPEFSSAFVEFSGIDDITKVVGAGNAILSYNEQAEKAANGFGIINAGENGATYDIGDYLTASNAGSINAINAALQRPSDQSKLVFAKGSLESGIAEINTAAGKKYITSLYAYAERNEGIVVNLFHEQMRIDISGRIGNIIKTRSLTEDTSEEMWGRLETFMRNRQDQFSSRTDGRTNSRLTDAMIRNFNWQAMNSVPLIDVIRGIDDADINLFERGLSGLFQQYTAYVEWNKNAIKQLLVQLPEDIDITKYRTSRQNILEYLYTYYIGPIIEIGKTWMINGRDHPITELIGWKNAIIHYPWGSFVTWLTTTASGMKLLTHLGKSNLLGGVVGLTGGGVGLTILGSAIGAVI
ncbi:putative membrane protein [Emiliania huxleyi virus 156]|nr:putative membrane protein [Emiliania huxleyi virus 156]